jgi:hypothetical protein
MNECSDNASFSSIYGKNGFTDKSETCVFSDGYSQIEIDKFGNITSYGKKINNENIINIISGTALFLIGSSKHDFTNYNVFIRRKKLKRILK